MANIKYFRNKTAHQHGDFNHISVVLGFKFTYLMQINIQPNYYKMDCFGDNCIQIFHLGTYIAGYTVGNFVLRQPVSRAVKHYFRPYIRRYTSPNEKFEYILSSTANATLFFPDISQKRHKSRNYHDTFSPECHDQLFALSNLIFTCACVRTGLGVRNCFFACCTCECD